MQDAGRSALVRGKAAGQRIAATTKSAGKKAAMLVGDLNKDGKVDHEDAKIAGAEDRVASGVKEKAGALAKAAAKHDMVKDAAAGAAIGAAVGIPVPIVGPAAGAAIGAVVGVAKNVGPLPNPSQRPRESNPNGADCGHRGRALRDVAAPTQSLFFE